MLSYLITMHQKSDKSNKKNILQNFINYKTLFWKILKAFKILFILAIKIEANVLSIKSRLNKKTRNYITRIITLTE